MARFELLTRIRIAHQFGTLEGRRWLARVRLQAFHVLFQCNPSAELLSEFYAGEPEFVSDLVGLLLAGEAVPEDLRIQALRVLAVQLLDRTHHTSVITAISTGGQSGLLSMLMHRAIASLAGIAGAGTERYSASFVEALLSLVGALSSSTSGCNALSEAGVVSALLPLLKDMHPDHRMLVGTAVRILEAFMDFQPQSATAFREIGGLHDMIERFRIEVEPQEKAGGGSREAMVTDTNVAAPSAAAQGPSTSATHAGAPKAAAKPIPYARRVLLKSLLRAIAMSSYAPGGVGRPQVSLTPHQTSWSSPMQMAERLCFGFSTAFRICCVWDRKRTRAKCTYVSGRYLSGRTSLGVGSLLWGRLS